MEIPLLLKALGEPTRYKIWLLLLSRKHCVRSLSRKLEISESAVSQHLKIMRDAGLIYGEKFGHHTHYIPDKKAVTLLAEAFSSMEVSLDNRHDEKGVCHCEMREAEK